jgi:hypothetical protein
MKSLNLIFILTISTLLFSCQKKWEIVYINKELNAFDTLILNDVFEVHLIQGNQNSIRMEGSKKILDNIQLDVKSNSLSISNNFSMSWIHPSKSKVKLFITFDTLSLIVANETCNILSDNKLYATELGLIMKSKLNHAELEVEAKSFYYWNNFPCGGTVKLSGQVDQLMLLNVALMAVDSKNLSCKIANIENASKGDIKINCSQKLNYSILGEGNIYLKGNPQNVIPGEIKGSGSLIKE